jgi:hypothetical protein
MKATFCIFSASLALLLGCASVSIKPVGTDYTEGLRFYRPSPYLLVTTNKDGAKSTSVVWLPDRSQEYYVKQNKGWGVSNLSVKLESGWNLIELGHVADSKGPETLNALGSLAANVGGLAGLVASLPLDAGLYEVLFDGNGKVSGLRLVTIKTGG